MEQGKKGQVVIGILVLIIIILVGTVYLFATGKINLNNENLEGKSKTNQITGSKIDSSKDYVYQADYQNDNKYQNYNRKLDNEISTGVDEKIGTNINIHYQKGEQSLSEFKVPYINIDTSEAGIINNKLENLYQKYAKKFDECASNEQGCYQVLSYYQYSYNNILSVVVIDGISETSPFIYNYSTYNFDLNTGKLLEYSTILTKLGYNSDEIINNVSTQLKQYLNNKYGENIDLNNCKNGTITDTCYNISNDILSKSITNNEVKFFVDDTGNINILAIPYADGVQNGTVTYYAFEITK